MEKQNDNITQFERERERSNNAFFKDKKHIN